MTPRQTGRQCIREKTCESRSASGPFCSSQKAWKPEAFTLLELLAVIMLIALLAGTLGLAMRSPRDTVAFQAAQSTLATLCTAARGEAALTGQNARLVIGADPADAENYLRFLQVVHEDPATAGAWIAEGGGIYLPHGIYVVPASTVPGNAVWPAARRSSALSPTGQPLTINHVAGSYYYVQFTARGTTGGGNLLLTTGQASDSAAGAVLTLDNPDNLRGVLLRTSGTLTLLNDARTLSP